ncbi:hypothetical protein AAFC00_005944 [Neodothiora populina]|uniref:Uncharacterized protein n=1 Tax=Neodothiora populina TaxID=2781224 RepID=A0ABR3P6R1_9PEZI
MDDLNFLKNHPKGNAVLGVQRPDGTTSALIEGLNLDIIEDVSPVLALVFDPTRSGPRHYLEDTYSEAVAASLLRYIYTDPRDYVADECKDGPISMLLHAQIYFLANIYDIDGLRLAAKANITRECELSCSSCMPPLDLCEAVNFIYRYMPTQKDIIDTISNYCVAMFLYHKLGQMQSFRELAFEHRSFQQDLCMVNINRGFVDEAALAIIQLPIRPFPDAPRNSLEQCILRDVLYHLWSLSDEPDSRDEVTTPRASNRYGNDRLSTTDFDTVRNREATQEHRVEEWDWPQLPRLDPSYREAIMDTHTVGIMALLNDEMVAQRKLDEEDLVNKSPSGDKSEPDTPPDIFVQLDTAKPLVLRGPKKTSLRFRPFVKKGELRQVFDEALPSGHKAPPQSPELLPSESDDDYIHVKEESDSEWLVV